MTKVRCNELITMRYLFTFPAGVAGLTTLVLTLSFESFASAAKMQYTHSMFIQALKHGGFVLIKVRYSETKFDRDAATPMEGLLGAIHYQYNLDFGPAGSKKASEIALASKDRVFSFTRSEAFDVIKPHYSAQQLVEVRDELANYDRANLIAQLGALRSKVHDLYTDPGRNVYREAVAHALLERGVLVDEDDRSGRLFAVEGSRGN